MECVVVASEIPILVKQECQAVVDLHRCKMFSLACVRKPEEPRELPSRRLFITSGNNGVIERNGHGLLLCCIGAATRDALSLVDAGLPPATLPPLLTSVGTPIGIDTALSPSVPGPSISM